MTTLLSSSTALVLLFQLVCMFPKMTLAGTIQNHKASYYDSVGCSTPDCVEFEQRNECQNLDNCPYSYENTMADYDAGSEVAISPQLSTFMSQQVPLYLKHITEKRPPSSFDAADVFNGLGGRAYMFLRLFNRTGNATYLRTAKSYIDSSLTHVESIRSDCQGFLWGQTGVYALAAVIASLQGDEDSAAAHIAVIQDVFDRSDDDMFAKYDDFDCGRAGLLYTSHFLNTFYERGDVISRDSVVSVAKAAVRRGKDLSDEPELYLEWVSPNDGGKWLGQSHGSAGVLSQLLLVPELLEEGSETRFYIEGTLNYIVNQQFASGNFPSEYYEAYEDVLVQWDHGAPGVMGVLATAARVLGNSTYMDSALRAADCTWERGLLHKGLMLCHGIMGNTYMQLFIGKMTGDEKFTFRALQFQEFVAQTPDLYDLDLMRTPTPNPYSLYTASYESAVMLWVDLLAAAETPSGFSSLYMPGYEPNV